MTGRPLKVWVLSDGQPGHYNQSRGIVAALERIRPLQVSWLPLTLRLGLARNVMRHLLNGKAPPPLAWLKLFYAMPVRLPDCCDLIVSVGGKTSFANAWLAERLGVKNIFAGSLRRLSPDLFDVVLTLFPLEPALANNLVMALPPNAIGAAALAGHGQRLRDKLGLGGEKLWALMIGGNGAGYRYRAHDWEMLARLINKLSGHYQRRWLLLGSRRTGRAAERILRTSVHDSRVAFAAWHGQNEGSIVEACLGAAEKVFVTEDSMTMLTEAIHSERPVISLHPPVVGSTPQYVEMLNRFERSGWLVRLPLMADKPEERISFASNSFSPLVHDAFVSQLAKHLQL